MEEYIQIAGLMSRSVENFVGQVVGQCNCSTALLSTLHAKKETIPPLADFQKHISLDDLHLEGIQFLRSIDSFTAWSKTGYITVK